MEVLTDQHPVVPEPEIPREAAAYLPMRSTHALVLTGVRRAGKSVLQSQLMRARKTPSFYCNMEDTRLFGLSPEDIPSFIDVMEEISPKRAAVFLDEVQEIPEWQRLVRAMLDRGRTVCVTGSNASLLGRELGAKLTGRHLSFEVFPFSYREYVSYMGTAPGPVSFGAFLDDGGFPAYLRERDPRVLQELLRDIVQRDIAIRHSLRETRHVMNIALFLLANTGQPVSMQSLTKSLAVPTVAQTSHYLEYLQNAYVLFALPKFSTSFKQRVVASPKYYAIDNGLRRANATQLTEDVGHRLENAVFLELRRTDPGKLSFAAERDLWECDFVTDSEAIQVCAEINPASQQREVRGILGAVALPGPKRHPLILTLNQRDRITVGGVTIDVRPTWEWMSER